MDIVNNSAPIKLKWFTKRLPIKKLDNGEYLHKYRLFYLEKGLAIEFEFITRTIGENTKEFKLAYVEWFNKARKEILDSLKEN